MIITRLIVTNYGVFRGKHEFDLRPRHVNGEVRPIVLFGGKNGAGKTTILDAIRICLYGRLALGTRVRRSDYDAYVMQMMHRGTTLIPPSRAAKVEVVFEHTHAGVRSIYDAIRSWRIERQDLQENISIYKDGQPLRDIPQDAWNDFLRDLIPPGVANLFFFDGEQIQSLANEETEASTLGTAISGLLNLDLIERLRADIGVYLKQQAQRERTDLLVQANLLESSFAEADAEYQRIIQDRASLRTRASYIDKKLDEARQRLVKEGANFAERRDQLDYRQKDVERLLERTREAIRELSNDLLPFAVAPRWLMQLRDRLQSEAEFQRAQILYELQDEKSLEVAIKLRDQEFQQRIAPSVTEDEWTRIEAALKVILRPTKPETQDVLHPVSDAQRTRMSIWISRALNDVPVSLYHLGKQLEELETERGALQQALSQIPSDEVANPLLEEFHQLSEERGRLQRQSEEIGEALASADFQRAELDRNRKKMWQELAAANDADVRVERAAKVQLVLNAYQEQITAIKISEMAVHLAQYFNRLCRKQHLVREVIIDPQTHSVALYGENRTELPKSGLSAGERQLYAMSLLWSLRTVSGRMLPIIVDTPMGRLDSDHRRTLLTEFFPHAAHQIVILSTDTEIDTEAYSLLRPYISHAYLLEYDGEEGCTQVESRYFDEPLEDPL